MKRQAQPDPRNLGHHVDASGDCGLQGHEPIDGLLWAADRNNRDGKQRYGSRHAHGAPGSRHLGIARPVSFLGHGSISRFAGAARVVAPSVEAFLAAGAGLARVGQREIAGRAGLDRCVDRENCVNSNLLASNGGGRVSKWPWRSWN